MNTRLLGIVCIVGSLTAIIGTLFFQVQFGAPPTNAIGYITVLLWPIGAIAGLTGLIQSNGVGSNPVVRAVAFLPVIAFGLTLVAVFVEATGLGSPGNILLPVSFLVLIIGMVLVGILTIAAKAWPGWRRFVPLFIILVVIFSRATGFVDNSLGQAIASGVWVVLGYAVATTEGTTALEQRATA